MPSSFTMPALSRPAIGETSASDVPESQLPISPSVRHVRLRLADPLDLTASGPWVEIEKLLGEQWSGDGREHSLRLMAVDSGAFKTMQDVISENGFDPVQKMQEMAEFNKITDSLGIVLDTDPRKMTATGIAQSTASGKPVDESGNVENETEAQSKEK
jgi:hypothetical protein